MMLILSPNTSPFEVEQLILQLERMGLRALVCREEDQLSLAIVGGEDKTVRFDQFAALPHVEQVLPFKQPYRLAGREFKTKRVPVDVGGVLVGGDELTLIAGPCSVESRQQIFESARLLKRAGVQILRGGAFKPRSSPYSFQGLEEEGLRYLQEAGQAFGLLTISEVMDSDTVDLVESYVDIFQVGARNMQNFSLLKRLGKAKKPVFLKRGLCATYQDLLMSAEYVLSGGNERVLLCERGIRTFETYTRNTLDLAAVPILQSLSHLPVIIDPSHGTGRRELIAPMACAALAARADGLMIEVHPAPDQALSDAQQTISPTEFEALMDSLRAVGSAVGITVPPRVSPLERVVFQLSNGRNLEAAST
jgi:3-deoxy-7-phosphoheptulonate synthase